MSYAGGVTGEEDTTLGKGSRRKKFAGYLRAANDLRQSYRESYASRDHDEVDNDEASIPGAFPELKVARNGNEEMILFPSYARRHFKRGKQVPAPGLIGGDDMHPSSDSGDAEYWKKEWEIYEDTNAIVDVDIRGWIYTPHKGPMTRRNRLLMGIARKLSGIPAPETQSQPSSRSSSVHQGRSERHEEEMAEREAAKLTQRGEMEADVAGRGGYSEGQGPESVGSSRSGSPKPGDFPHPISNTSLQDGSVIGGLAKRASWNQPSNMTLEELTRANGHLLARLKPFLSNPSIDSSLTVFFYNSETSQSRTTRTNDSGHFNLRAALNFVPTHVRVLASESLSATEEVLVTEPKGVSLISDIDDTIKHSAIGSGAREIFRNAFIRDLDDLTIEGVREWYDMMANKGVKMHYVSNSPWQMYPLLVSYFAKAGLPSGSFHLKQYSGMLQGIFEPVAERKRGTLDRIMNDFPERRFILVGDSGEADLEVYTETALMNPGRILGIFIRDVTTSPKKGFFDPSNGTQASKPPFPSRSSRDFKGGPMKSESRPALPPRPFTQASSMFNSSDTADLIDFSEDLHSNSLSRSFTDPLSLSNEHVVGEQPRPTAASEKSVPPLRPAKPLALRSRLNDIPSSDQKSTSSSPGQEPSSPAVKRKPAPPPPRRSAKMVGNQVNDGKSDSSQARSKVAPPPPSKRSTSLERAGYTAVAKSRLTSAYNSLPSASTYWHSDNQTTSPLHRSHSSASTSSSVDTMAPAPASQAPPLPARRGIGSYPAVAAQYASDRWYGTGDQEDNTVQIPPISKREELWNRRWLRAQEVLEKKGILLRSWRLGNDVMDEATALVEKAEMEDRKST